MRISWLAIGILALTMCTAPACMSTQDTPSQGEWAVLQSVERGMSPAEVRRIMGEPRRTVRSNGELQWMVYGSSAQRVLIYFQGNKVEAIPQNSGRKAVPAFP